jgi:hypothetical protein
MGILHERELGASESGHTVDTAIGDATERPAAEPSNAFIEFWVWHDGELLPATDDELEWIREREREREARRRLRRWAQLQDAQHPTALQRVGSVLATWLAGGQIHPRRPSVGRDASRDRMESRR